MKYDDDEDFVDEYLLPDDDEDEGKLTDRDKRVLVIVALLCAGIPTLSALVKISWFLGNLMLGGIILSCGALSYKDKNKKYPDRRYGSATVMISGAAVIVRALTLTIVQKLNVIPNDRLSNMDMIGLAVFLVALGVAIIAIPFAADKKQRERCCFPVTAVCIGVSERHMKNGKLFIPLWEYTVGGRKYQTLQRSVRHPNDAVIGDTIEFIVTPDDPTEVYHDASMSKLLGVLFGLIVASGGSAIILHFIKVI